jgi:hypothetical protein
LFDRTRRGNIGKSVQNLNTTSRTVCPAAALMEMWNPVADRYVQECLTFGDIFKRDFVKVSDFWHY